MNRNSERGFEQPWLAWPRMEFLEGEQAFYITGKYAAPSLFWQVSFVMILFMVVWPQFMLFSCSYLKLEVYGDITGEAWLWSIFGTGGVLAVIAIAGAVLGPRRRLDVKVSREAIEIGGRRYARAAPHQFAVEEHERAHREAAAARKGHNHRIYREAMQVVMRYGELRIAIADFRRRDVRKAEALLVRLQVLDQGLEEMLTGAHAHAAAPAERDDFGRAHPIR